MVFRAVDVLFDREVAVKVMRPHLATHRRHRPRFLREAAICGRLAHPNIVPIIDVGRVGKPPALVMSLLAGRSLRTLLRAHAVSLGRLIGALTQVCNGVAFAHSQGVVHRDIKPAHIFVGDFGQVVLTDWGLAKALVDQPAPTSNDVTRIGDIVGTPAYMAPEQGEGRLDQLDHRADIYALGAVLYEILTGTRPYEASGSAEVLQALREGPPESPSARAPHRDIDPGLEAVCLRAMSRDPRQRFDSALDLATNLDAWFEAPVQGATFADRSTAPAIIEAESTATVRPSPEAAQQLAEGRAEAAAFSRELQAADELRIHGRRLTTALTADATEEARDDVWRVESEARQHLEQAAWHLGQGVGRLEQAMLDSAQEPLARAGLAKLHRDAWQSAEAHHDVVSAGYHRARAERFDDGLLSAELAGRAALTVLTHPPGVRVSIATIDDRAPLWRPGPTLIEGVTPMSARTISAARLLLRFEAADGLTTRLPVRAEAGTTHVVRVHMPPSGHVPPGFVFIPGGRFVGGADDLAPGAAPLRDVELHDYCLARLPVTAAEYFGFLEDLLTVGANALAHFPRTRGKPMVTVRGGEVQWLPRFDSPLGAPVRGVSHDDAKTYAAWLARRLGAPIRLPTECEWAYAAGAVDGRSFPWGDGWVPGLADSRQRGNEGPRAVSAFPHDISPFGIRGLAGGVREWTATEAELEPNRYLLRGGAWRAPPAESRVGARATGPATLTHGTIGIRLAADLPKIPV